MLRLPLFPLFFIIQVAGQTPPVGRAVSYLAAESAKWRPENGCFSCHNNGDAARVLFLAKTAPPAALTVTAVWLANPASWDENGSAAPEASDKKLARIQFSAALLASPSASADSLGQAATLLLSFQDTAGPWRIEPEAGPGSPITYGTTLATLQALRVLQATSEAEFASPIARARRWLHSQSPANLPDTAALILARHPQSTAFAAKLLASQTASGGWGPQPGAPSEVFDTALCLLALRSLDTPEFQPAIAKGRRFRLDAQLPEGGWPETTRPSGGRSYAHHISTSAWALEALLPDPHR
jgi:hypothetical protein